jgi:NAD(P)-dependent dehydrogenase (short-subunit alcohol dehydrogenase family)
MRLSIRALNSQTIAITDATSGISLAAAREAARRGAKVFVAVRSQDDPPLAPPWPERSARSKLY